MLITRFLLSFEWLIQPLESVYLFTMFKYIWKAYVDSWIWGCAKVARKMFTSYFYWEFPPLAADNVPFSGLCCLTRRSVSWSGIVPTTDLWIKTKNSSVLREGLRVSAHVWVCFTYITKLVSLRHSSKYNWLVIKKISFLFHFLSSIWIHDYAAVSLASRKQHHSTKTHLNLLLT